MLSCGQRNEDILTQAGTCHTDNINGHSQPKHHTNHGVQPGVVLLHKEHQLHSAPFQIETKKSNLPQLCHLLQSAGLKLTVSFPSALQQTFIISKMSESFRQNTYRCFGIASYGLLQ